MNEISIEHLEMRHRQSAAGADAAGAPPIPQAFWLQVCARRISELEPGLMDWEAHQIAVRLLWGREWPPSWREMHPVAAAEAWQLELHAGLYPHR
jgi:hypothetical protein